MAVVGCLELSMMSPDYAGGNMQKRHKRRIGKRRSQALTKGLLAGYQGSIHADLLSCSSDTYTLGASAWVFLLLTIPWLTLKEG
jgi:hypothetical protein